MNIERDKKCFPFHFCRIRLNGRPDWSDVTVYTKELIHVSVHVKYKPNVQASNEARYHARVLYCFPDPLLAWTFYCSSDSLSTELQGHCIAREIWIHTVHHPLSPFIVQTATRPTHCRPPKPKPLVYIPKPCKCQKTGSIRATWCWLWFCTGCDNPFPDSCCFRNVGVHVTFDVSLPPPIHFTQKTHSG